MLSTYLSLGFNTSTYWVSVFCVIYFHFYSMKQVKVPQALWNFNWSCLRVNLQQRPPGQTARRPVIPHSSLSLLICILYCSLFSVLPRLNSNFVVWINRENILLRLWSVGLLFFLMDHKCGPYLFCGTLFKIRKL